MKAFFEKVGKSRCFLLLFLLSFVFLNVAQAAAEGGLAITSYTLKTQKRLSRYEYEYTYTAGITSTIPGKATQVTASIISVPTGVVIVNGNLNFGDVSNGETINSTNTFTIRVNRKYPFNQNALVWDIFRQPDLTAPNISIAYPGDQAYLGFKTPNIMIFYGDANSGINLKSFSANINGKDVTDKFVLTDTGASYQVTDAEPLPEGLNYIIVSIKDNEENLATTRSDFSVNSLKLIERVSKVISASEGGEVEISESGNMYNAGVKLEIPAGALSNDTEIKINDAVNGYPPVSQNTTVVGLPMYFEPSGLTFSEPSTLKIPYTDKELSYSGVTDPSKIRVITYNGVTKTWENVPIEYLDTVNKYLIVKVSHFCLWCTVTDGDNPFCGAPAVDSKMYIENPTCEEKWNYYNCLKNLSLIDAHAKLVYAKITGDEIGHAIVDYVVTVGGILTWTEDSLGEIINFDVPQFMLKMLPEEDNAQNVAAGLTDTFLEAVHTTVVTGATKVVPSAVVVLPDTLTMINDFLAAWKIDAHVEELNNYFIARLYLEEYYKYGGDNGRVAESSGAAYNSSLWDTIDAFAKSRGYKNNWYGTEYHINKIQDIVEHFKYKIIPPVTAKSISDSWAKHITDSCYPVTQTCYQDKDGDGFGDIESLEEQCVGLPEGYSLNNWDCNDGSKSIHPYAKEICDGIDNNCDGAIDKLCIPSPPANLRVSGDSANVNPLNVPLRWDSVQGDEIKYCVTVNQDSEPYDIPVYKGCDNGEFTLATNLPLPVALDYGKTYWWAVWAKDKYGVWSAASEWSSFTTIPPLTLDVGPAGSGYPYNSIQAAIDDVGDGCTILVHDGTYVERIDFNGKAITVRSKNGAARTIIKGNVSGSVVTFKLGEGAGSVLDGFTITNGRGTLSGWYRHTYGGGISCFSASPTINNCIISGNSSHMGGGISCSSSSPVITNCTISINSAGVEGGGIYCLDYSSPTIINCTISNNSGGGIYCEYSSPRISNCTISSNTDTCCGGGIICNYYSSPTLINCTISNNQATWFGGGIHCHVFSFAVITNCTISDNSAGYDGGGISCAYFSSPMITNCTISGNSARYGGGIFCHSSSPVVKNSILWENSPQEIYLDSSNGYSPSITVIYSDVQMISSVYPGIGNINSDPRFVGNSDYHLTPGSPCIDAANSDSPALITDKDGNPRFDDPNTPNTGAGANGNYYDMGAYEFISWSSPEEIVSGDGIWSPSIAVDNNGRWHIVYRQTTETDNIMYQNSYSVPKVLDSAPGFIANKYLEEPSITIDSKGRLHIVYVSSPSGGKMNSLRYTNNISGNWSSPEEIVSGDGIWSPSIAVDSNGRWHIVYRQCAELGQDNIMYQNSYSTPRVLDSAPGFIANKYLEEPSITIDSKGGLHIIYVSSPNGGEMNSLRYTNNISGNWSSPEEIVSGDGIWSPSIAVDNNGRWHIVYRQFAEQDNIVYQNSYSVPKVLDSAPGYIGKYLQYPSITIDSKGGLHIVYVSSPNGGKMNSLRYINQLR